MKYLLAIYIPPDYIDTEQARKHIDSVRALDPQPDHLLVVDHIEGLPVADESEVETRSLLELHDMADEVLSGKRAPGNHALARRWRRAGALKAFALQAAQEQGLDAALLLHAPGRLTAEAPRAMLAHLERHPDLSCAYVRTYSETWCGKPQSGVMKCDREVTTSDQFLPTWGNMLRTSCYDAEMCGELWLSRERNPREEGPRLSDTVYVKMMLLAHGPGQGVGYYGDVPLRYTHVGRSPLARLPEMGWHGRGEEEARAAAVRIKKMRNMLTATADRAARTKKREG